MSTLDSVDRFQSKITDWLSPYVDLSDFGYLYGVNGITEAMNFWMWQESRDIKMATDDYQWIDGSNQGEVLYMSTPASYDGNYVDIPIDIPVVLDLAYLGSTAPRFINIPPNVERVFYSLSKTFGLRNYRIGYCWCRTPDARLEMLQSSAKYYNYHSMSLGETIISNLDLPLVHHTLHPFQVNICDELELTPSDVLWIATTDDPVYSKFFRNHTNRVCIADIIKEKYHACTN
jgi:hypothetical protein